MVPAEAYQPGVILIAQCCCGWRVLWNNDELASDVPLWKLDCGYKATVGVCCHVHLRKDIHPAAANVPYGQEGRNQAAAREDKTC